jgi:DNA-binding beta-propeller fold protein YncE
MTIFEGEWGTEGSGDGQFRDPIGVATDADGSVYVADTDNNNRIQKFTSNGAFLTEWGGWHRRRGVPSRCARLRAAPRPRPVGRRPERRGGGAYQ